MVRILEKLMNMANEMMEATGNHQQKSLLERRAHYDAFIDPATILHLTYRRKTARDSMIAIDIPCLAIVVRAVNRLRTSRANAVAGWCREKSH